MKATANLENDHVSILKLCDVMEKITLEEKINFNHIEEIVIIIRNFADGLHHKKEEEFLFPKMSEKGFPLDSGPLAVMLNDHEAGRSYVRGIAESISAYKTGGTTEQKLIYANFAAYVDLLRNHIGKENNVLFRMADNSFSDKDSFNLLSLFFNVS